MSTGLFGGLRPRTRSRVLRDGLAGNGLFSTDKPLSAMFLRIVPDNPEPAKVEG